MSSSRNNKEDEEEEYRRELARIAKERRQVEEMNEQDKPQTALGKALVGLPVVGALFGKGKYVVVASKLFKFKSLASMALSVGAYSLFFGWQFAVGVVGMLAVHEAGHALVMLQRGIPVGQMSFIPFLGITLSLK